MEASENGRVDVFENTIPSQEPLENNEKSIEADEDKQVNN